MNPGVRCSCAFKMTRILWTLLFMQVHLVLCNIRPIWNIAHMINAVDQVHEYIDYGANAIESDVEFTKDGVPSYTYHGFPCDCFRNCFRSTTINVFLDYISKVADKNSPEYKKNLVLVLLDVKVKSLYDFDKYKAGMNLASLMLSTYWKNDFYSVPYVVLSAPYTSSRGFFEGFMETLRRVNLLSPLENRFGFDISMNEDPLEIQNMYQSVNIGKNTWLGDGITNCLFRRTKRLNEIIKLRDSKEYMSIDKVYYWTVDSKKTIRKVLRMAVDGFITNQPERVVQILQEPEFNKTYRLATAEDNPWLRIRQPQSLFSMLKASRQDDDQILVNLDDEELSYLMYRRSDGPLPFHDLQNF